MKKCSICEKLHDGSLGSGRFCSKSCISKFASLSRSRDVLDKINASNKGKKHSEESKEKTRLTLKNTIANFSEEKRKENSKKHSIKHKPHKPHKKWNEESRLNQSLKRTIYINSGKAHCNYYSVWNGEELIKVQGTWEKRIGETLTKLNIKWERKILAYAKTKHYTPDFYLPKYDIYLEIKGWMSNNNIKKYKEVINETHISLKLIDNLQLITLFEEGKITIFDLKNFEDQYDNQIKVK